MKRRLLWLIPVLLAVIVIPLPLLLHGGAMLTHWIFIAVLVWALGAYLLVPRIWKIYFRHRYADAPEICHTGDGHPGDPINLAVKGGEEMLIRALTSAGWFPATPITLLSSIRIFKDTVFRKPDANAPVSNLYLFGRKQDLAFELPVGNNPRQRHHVRFWRRDDPIESEPVWYGAATFDESVGLSRTTGQVTHHIGPDVDAERDLIMKGLEESGWVTDSYFVEGFHKQCSGRNGGGDPWQTDGRLGSIVLLQRKQQT